MFSQVPVHLSRGGGGREDVLIHLKCHHLPKQIKVCKIWLYISTKFRIAKNYISLLLW